VADWVTISSLATAGGTLVLAAATFASVKSANRAARVAERALLVNLRPLLVPTRHEDPPQKISFQEGHLVHARGGAGVAEATDDAIYLAIPLRNAGTGLAVLHGWRFYPHPRFAGSETYTPIDAFVRLTRDLYVAPGDIGFWQGTFRNPASDEYREAREAIEARERLTVDLLYGDYEGGQRVISRFGLLPFGDDGWMAVVARHWNVDRPDPR
jgi:hypothetical protein